MIFNPPRRIVAAVAVAVAAFGGASAEALRLLRDGVTVRNNPLSPSGAAPASRPAGW